MPGDNRRASDDRIVILSGMKRRKATANADRPTKTARKKAQIAKLRIIGGQMRGRTIQYHGAEFTRPMKDNIRENLFNILGPAVRNTICYDLFSGTGALAFESISRGASKAVAVEQSRHAVGFIRKTAEQLDISDRFQVLQGNAFRLSSELLGPPDQDTPWIVFLSPPYALWNESLPQLITIINSVLQHGPPGSVLVAETDKQFDTANLPPGDWDIRQYGGTRLAFIEPVMRCGLQS